MSEQHGTPISHREPAATLLVRPWRVGRSTGRAIYCGWEDESAIGFMDTRELAAAVVTAVNGRAELLDILMRMRRSSTPVVQQYFRELCTAFAVRSEEVP